MRSSPAARAASARRSAGATPTRAPASSSPTSWTTRPRRWRARSAATRFAVPLDVTRRASIDAMVETVVAHGRRHRHPGQQRRHLRHGAAARDHRGELRQAVRGQRQGPAVHAPGGGGADGQAGPRRQDRQLREPGRPARRAAGRGLLRLQGGGDQPHPVGGPGPDQARRSTSTASRPAWSTRRCGTRSTPCSPSTRACRSARRSARSARPCPTAGWARPRTWSVPRCSWPPSDADYVVAQTLNVDGGNWMS